MDYPQIVANQFMDADAFNTAFTTLFDNDTLINSVLFTPGVVNPMMLMSSTANLQVTLTLPSPFAVLFGNGILAQAHGVDNNTTSTSYEVDLTSLVPSSNQVVAYIVASLIEIEQDPFTVTGPPIGHPDYNPTFAPYVAQATTQYSLQVTATTTPPDNMTTFELGRFTLSVGQTSLMMMTTSFQMLAAVNVPMAFSSLNTIRMNGSANNPSANENILVYTVPFACIIPSGLPQSVASALTGPANGVSFAVMYYPSNSQSGTQIGSILMNANNLVGNISGGGVSANVGDRIVVVGPNVYDPQLRGFSVTIVADITINMVM